MRQSFITFLVFCASCLLSASLLAQEKDTMVVHQVDTIVVPPQKPATEDTALLKNPLALDTVVTKEFSPRTAILRSAILPGWGQAYNKKYWKIPIVYGALGVSAGVFFYNLKTYKELRQAVIYRRDDDPMNDTLIAPNLRPLSTESLTFYRNAYRQNIDYSVLAFLVLWGLNVVDAAVDAHLKSFNVSPDLTLKARPQYHFNSGTAGVSLVFQFRKRDQVFTLPH